MIHIVKSIQRPPKELVEAFGRHGSATVHEAMGRTGAMARTIKPLARGMKVCGPAFTVRVQAGDNVMILKAIHDAQPGDVIVVDCGRCPESGPFGEMAATGQTGRDGQNEAAGTFCEKCPPLHFKTESWRNSRRT